MDTYTQMDPFQKIKELCDPSFDLEIGVYILRHQVHLFIKDDLNAMKNLQDFEVRRQLRKQILKELIQAHSKDDKDYCVAVILLMDPLNLFTDFKICKTLGSNLYFLLELMYNEQSLKDITRVKNNLATRVRSYNKNINIMDIDKALEVNATNFNLVRDVICAGQEMATPAWSEITEAFNHLTEFTKVIKFWRLNILPRNDGRLEMFTTDMRRQQIMNYDANIPVKPDDAYQMFYSLMGNENYTKKDFLDTFFIINNDNKSLVKILTLIQLCHYTHEKSLGFWVKDDINPTKEENIINWKLSRCMKHVTKRLLSHTFMELPSYLEFLLHNWLLGVLGYELTVSEFAYLLLLYVSDLIQSN